ncbi:50S ribosomal protein L11 [Rhodobacter sp. KR11]|jgi:large subunit ribosomal protein L11|uniref:50S ribosomal protein L11 n=1 Tax=Rhodobacter sp. KR11 TaxID=2974588 RepID=UPI0022217127|nr:50S ribosomal protein L11 [Rhodobacter sp. KR11]MCW1920899.1 50S ribosomal protein L11 [Rhodobacter sp. KR11]
MAKKIMGSLKLQVKAQQANPSPPVGPALGQRGLNIMAFVKEFNAKSADFPPGTPVPVVITYYQDKSFSLELKTPPTSFLLKQAANLPLVGKRNRAKGSVKPGHAVAGSVTVAAIRKIAETKMKDLNANDVEAAMTVIVGTAKSCGIEIKG